MTAKEAAALLGVHLATVARLAKCGDLREMKKFPGIRGARLFHRDEVARVAAERNLAP